MPPKVKVDIDHVPVTGKDAGQRAAALVELITLRIPVGEAVAQVRTLPWDSDDELAILDRAAAASALLRFRSGDLGADELEAWAEAIEGREDIGVEPGHEEMLSEFVFETANPTLAEALSDHYAAGWLERLTRGVTP